MASACNVGGGKEVERAPSSFKSHVWEHFGFSVNYNNDGRRVVDKKVVVCRHCATRKTYKGGNTSSMATHLTRHHPGVLTGGTKKQSSQHKLSPVKVEQDDHLADQTDTCVSFEEVEQQDNRLADQTGSSCGSGSPEEAGPPGSSCSGSGGSSGPAAQFWKKCHQARCTEFIFSELTSRLNSISERILSQQANEEDFNLSMKVLEASGMLPEIFAKRDQELEKRLNELQKESEALWSARCAMRETSVISFTSH